ncbi:MAG: dockerin type I domain-containing protein [Ruminococcus sp.]
MKKFLITLLITIITCLSVFAVSGLNINDATAIQKYLAGFSVENFDKNSADYNKDGVIDIRDVTAIQRELAKVTDTIPKETEDIGDILIDN